MKNIRIFLNFLRLIFQRLRSFYYVAKMRCFYGVKIGKNVRIYSPIKVFGYGKIVIGDNTVFSGAVILRTVNSQAQILIGDNCFVNGTIFCAALSVVLGNRCITSDCEIMDTSSHGIDPQRRNDPAAIKIGAIEVMENVWIGSKAMVMPGVTIGKNTIIGVLSVVSRNIPENVFAAGIPASEIKNLG